MIEIVPIGQRAARAWMNAKHRHLSAPRGDLFRAALSKDGEVVAVAMAGRPCRMLQDGRTAEITRLASIAEADVNACSRLYSALTRAGKALGYRRFVTYTRMDESGVSLRASGFQHDGQTTGGQWSRPSRNRQPAEQPGQKNRWIYPGRHSGLWNKVKHS